MCSLPFIVSRDAGVGLVDQMVAGVKDAIACGRYRIGDRLPSINEFARLAGVSRRVPKTALRRLADEGWIVAQPRKGCLASNPGVPVWKGRILLVFVNSDDALFASTLRLRDLLESNGYLVQITFVRCLDDGSFDLRSFKAALFGTFDLACCQRPIKAIADCLAESSIPYVLGCARPRPEYLPHDQYYRGCVCGDDGFVSEVAAALRKGRIRHVAFVNFQDVFDRHAARLRCCGFDVEVVHTPFDGGFATARRVRDDAARLFAERYGAGQRTSLPEVFLFMDDYVADGALCALARAGVRIPQDVKVVTLYNNEVGLAYQANFSRIEYDAKEAAEVYAGYLLAILAGRRVAAPRIGFRYVQGDTL